LPALTYQTQTQQQCQAQPEHQPALLSFIDHIALAYPTGTAHTALQWYQKTLGLSLIEQSCFCPSL
jgi:4-hydroxyphenylpyruvate dioxygenase-like putative hemolysin